MIEICDYDGNWPRQFADLEDRLWPILAGAAVAIEHVGSTSVPGLAAKPVLDIDVVIASRSDLAAVVAGLASAGYTHRGNLGIDDREAFVAPADGPRHHLYVCSSRSLALRNHLTLRDHLRQHPADAAEYGALKRKLGAVSTDVDAYVRGKTGFILAILSNYPFTVEDLAAIRRVNTEVGSLVMPLRWL